MLKHAAIAIALITCGLPSLGRAQSPATPSAAADTPAPADSLRQAAFPAPADSTAPADSLAAPATDKHFLRAAAEVTATNVVVWAFCRYIREGGTNTGFRISAESWNENLLNGFEWDDNQFATNMFAHPYNGSAYFCAGRANGFDYYESIGFSFAGSAMWEYFGEVHHPSINDWINTSVGGIALGETLDRLSGLLLDQRARGKERFWREFGGFIINPVGGFNRIVTGQANHVGANPSEWRAFPFTYAVRVGARLTGEGTLSNSDTIRAFTRLRGVLGDPAGSVIRKPYDAFSVDVQFNADDKSPIGRVQVLGILRSWETGHTDKAATYFAITNTWDYIDNFAYEIGGQSFGAGFFAKTKSSDGWVMNTGLTANWIVMGATTSDYKSYTGREYDYGPGAGGAFVATLRRGRTIFALESNLWWLRIMNGTDASHLVAENRLTAAIPVFKSVNIGAEYSMYHAERHYADYPDVSQRNPQLTAYLSFIP